jgi:hypothetical protein
MKLKQLVELGNTAFWAAIRGNANVGKSNEAAALAIWEAACEAQREKDAEWINDNMWKSPTLPECVVAIRTSPLAEPEKMKPLCIGCNKHPDEIEEYVETARDEGMTPDEYVREEEGTYNKSNGHFLCTTCYVNAGMPSSPFGWTAP